MVVVGHHKGPLYRIKFLITPVNKGFFVASCAERIVPRIGEDEVMIIGKCQRAKLAAWGGGGGGRGGGKLHVKLLIRLEYPREGLRINNLGLF